MPDKQEEVLLKLGLIRPNVETLDDDADYDYIAADGTKYHGPDFLYKKVLEEELYEDVRDNGEMIESYWEKAWSSGTCSLHRSNYDVYRERYFKSFPTRYKLWEFIFTKSLRRILKKNADLKTIIRPLRVTKEKEKLFLSHYLMRYKKPPPESLTKAYEYQDLYPSDLTELCVFKNEKLIACSIFEVARYAMVSNACFWDINEADRSLGTYTILREVQYALEKRMVYYYLGSYYKQNPNYQYKTRFRGLELFDWENNYWIDFRNSRVKEMLNEKLPRQRD
jgi:arginine-tRNA-protein transferase